MKVIGRVGGARKALHINLPNGKFMFLLHRKRMKFTDR